MVEECIYNGVMWLMNNGPQLLEVGNKVFSSVDDIIQGNTKAVAAKVQASLDGLVEPAIDMIAQQLGLKGLPKAIGDSVHKLHDQIQAKVDGFFNAIIGKVKTFLGLNNPAPSLQGMVGPKIEFKVAGKDHFFWVVNRSGKMVAMLDGPDAAFDIARDVPASVTAAQQTALGGILQRFLTSAGNLDRLGRPAANPPAGQSGINTAALRAEATTYNGIGHELKTWLQTYGCAHYLGACFGAGTPLLTPDGPRPIEEFKVGDRVLSRHEADPEGALEAKEVQEVFVRTGKVVHVHVGGQEMNDSYKSRSSRSTKSPGFGL